MDFLSTARGVGPIFVAVSPIAHPLKAGAWTFPLLNGCHGDASSDSAGCARCSGHQRWRRLQSVRL